MLQIIKFLDFLVVSVIHFLVYLHGSSCFMLLFDIQGRNLIVKLADSHKGRTIQTQLPAAMVPMALPLAAGYPQPGKAHASTTPVGYNYPQAVVSYPESSYPSPPTASAPYHPMQNQVSYAQVTLKKDSLGLPPTPPVGMAGYPYYIPKR